MLDPDKVSLLSLPFLPPSLPPDIALSCLSRLRMLYRTEYYIDECELRSEERRLKAEALCIHTSSNRSTTQVSLLISLCSFISHLCLTSPLSCSSHSTDPSENAFPALSSMPSSLHILHSLDLDHWILMVSTSLHFYCSFFIYVMYFFCIHSLCIGLLAFFMRSPPPGMRRTRRSGMRTLE